MQKPDTPRSTIPGLKVPLCPTVCAVLDTNAPGGSPRNVHALSLWALAAPPVPSVSTPAITPAVQRRTKRRIFEPPFWVNLAPSTGLIAVQTEASVSAVLRRRANPFSWNRGVQVPLRCTLPADWQGCKHQFLRRGQAAPSAPRARPASSSPADVATVGTGASRAVSLWSCQGFGRRSRRGPTESLLVSSTAVGRSTRARAKGLVHVGDRGGRR
jgi:hypothetical protein